MAAPAKLSIDIIVNAAKAKKELGDTSDDVEGLGKKTEGTSKGMSAALAGFAGGAAFSAVRAGFGMLQDVVTDSIKAASDLNETTTQTGQIFGAAAPNITAFASTSAEALGMSKRAAMDAANTFATFGKAAGLGGDDLTSFSTDLVGLSADMASFKNTTPEEAITAVGAALRGESEPIRKYGVLLDDASLKARALKMGLISSTDEALTPQNKALAAQAEILAQTSDAQGDFARTSDGLANQQRTMNAQFEDMEATLGNALLPVLTELGNFLTKTLIPALQSFAGFVADNAGWFVPLAAGIVAVGLAVKGWAIAQALLNSSLAANPIFLIIGAVVAFAAALIWLFNNNETFRNGVIAAWEAISGAVKPILEAIGNAISWIGDNVLPPVKEAFTSALDAIGSAFSWLWDNAIHPIIDFIVDAIGVWWTIAKVEFDLIKGAIEILAGVFSWLWDTVIHPVVDFIVAAIQAWWNVATVVFDAIKVAIDVLAGVFTWLWDTVIHPIIDFIVGAIEMWWNVLKTEFDLIMSAIHFVGDVFSWLWDHISPIFDSLVNLITNWVSSAIDGVNTIVGVFRSIVGFLSEIVGRVWAIGETMWGWVAGGVDQVKTWIFDAWNGVINFIGGIAGKLADAARGMWDGIWDAFKSVINLIIRGWNALEFRIPGFDLGPVHFDGFTLGVPDIPYLAAGGLVRRSTLAVVGEAGAEIVSPVPMLRRLLAEAPTGGSTVINYITVPITHTGLGVDSPALQRDVAELLRRYEQTNGPVLVGR